MTDVPANPYRYYPPKLPHAVALSNERLLALWESGRNTYDIALQTGIPEYQIERHLHRVLEGVE